MVSLGSIVDAVAGRYSLLEWWRIPLRRVDVPGANTGFALAGRASGLAHARVHLAEGSIEGTQGFAVATFLDHGAELLSIVLTSDPSSFMNGEAVPPRELTAAAARVEATTLYAALAHDTPPRWEEDVSIGPVWARLGRTARPVREAHLTRPGRWFRRARWTYRERIVDGWSLAITRERSLEPPRPGEH